MAFLAAIAIAALIQTSVAQTTHTVGDTTGWAIPTGDPAFYSSWAANQTFNVGEILGNTTTLFCWWEEPLVVALKHSEGIKHTVLFQ